MINVDKFVYTDEDVLEFIVLKHGDHDQQSHGNWAGSGLSAKEREIHQRITNIKKGSWENYDKFAEEDDERKVQYIEAEYTTKDKKKYILNQENIKEPSDRFISKVFHSIEVKAYEKVQGGIKEVGSLNTEGGESGKIEGVYVLPEYQRQGIATAMLNMARTYAPNNFQIEHSFSLTEDAENWSSIVKHGTGDQKAHGNWAIGRVSAKLTQSILDRVKANGGLSVNMKDGSEPTKGYMVASPVKQAPVVDADDFFNPTKGRKILADFVKANKKDLGGGKKYLGLWHNKEDNKVYLDVSENVQDKSTATRLGRQRNQISIWDVVNFDEIETGGTGVTKKRRDSDGGVTIKCIGDDRRTNRFLGGFDLRQNDEVGKHSTHDQSSHAGSRRRIGPDASETDSKKPKGEQEVTDPNAPKPKLKPGRKPDPSGSLEERAEKLANGERIQVTKGEAKKMMKIMAKREDDPDLTNMHIEGTQLYDEDNLGIPRNKMPQVPSDTKAVFISEMEKRGVRVQRGVADPTKLHPIQAEMSASKVGLIMKKLRKNGMKTDDGGRIVISKDNYVIDGHHRWAAAAMLNFEDSSIKLPVIRVDMNHKDLIDVTLAWNKASGIESIGLGQENPNSTFKKWAEFDYIIAKAISGRTIVRFQPGLKPVVKHQQHDQQSHGSWAQQKPNSNNQLSVYIEQTLPWAIAEAQKRGYGPAYTMGQIPKDETVPQGLRNLHEEFNQKNSSTESAKALEFYTSDNYKKVNNALRDGTFNPQDRVVTDIDIIVNDLDRLVSQSNKTSATVEVFRGIKGTNSLSDLKVGQGFTDKAYTSTTLDPRLALTSFSSPRSGKILRITVPKGIKGIYVPDWFGAKDERAQTKKEQEFILPRGSSFRVTNIDGNVISLEMDSIE